MAPKRRRVVKTTRKVVRETVRVSVIDSDTEGINTRNQSLPDFGGETEELQTTQEGMGTETPDTIDLIGGMVTTPPPSTRMMSTRRTIIVEDKTPDTSRRIPVEEPATPRETVPVRTEERVEEKPEEQQDKEKAREEDRGTGMTSWDQTEGEQMRAESEETEGGKAPPVVEQEDEKAEAREKRKAEKGGEGEKKTRKRRRRRRTEEGNEEYRRYVFQVLKQVHPGMRISGQAMAVLNGYMNDMFEPLAEEAARLSRYTRKPTLSSREIQGAVRLVLPGELGRHAIAEGAKAISNYMSYGVP